MAAAKSSVLAETNRSIRAALKSKILDASLHAGPIAALRKLAEQIDDPDFPVINGKFDNVSIPTYLRACDQLHLTPAATAQKPKGAVSGGNGNGGTLASLREQREKHSA